MTLVFILLYYWVETSRISIQAPYYIEKMEAAETVSKAMEILREYRLPSLDQRSHESSSTDPLVFTMLGEKNSPITTDEGNIEDKITVLNPNFAAVVVDMLAQAGCQPGDTIAVLLTGSMPGANLAVFAAAKAMKLHQVSILSVGSSWWGANSPDFTWLDMENILERENVFNYHSIAASIGGADDHGGLRLSDQGRKLIVDAIDRNGVTFINQGSLSKNIDGRMEVFNRITPIENFKAVINVGGGIAAIGHSRNVSLIPSGINKHLPIKNYPNLGVIHRFSNAGVPVVMVSDVKEIARQYDLPIASLPLPKIGIGDVFEVEKYNISVATVAVILMFIILVLVKYFDRKGFKYREQNIDPDTIV